MTYAAKPRLAASNASAANTAPASAALQRTGRAGTSLYSSVNASMPSATAIGVATPGSARAAHGTLSNVSSSSHEVDHTPRRSAAGRR